MRKLDYRSTAELHPTFAEKFQIFSKIFSDLGCCLTTPSGDGYVWRVSKGDAAIVFLSDSLPLNSSPAALIAKDKLATYQVLSACAQDIPKGLAFFADTHCGKPTLMPAGMFLADLNVALERCFSSAEIKSGLIVKPGMESGGLGVRLCCGVDDILQHGKSVLIHSHYGIVQEFVPGQEFRVAILGEEILVTYRKRNPLVSADGSSTLRQLLKSLLLNLKPQAKAELDTSAMLRLLHMEECDLDSVLPAGQTLELNLETRNLSQGAWPELVDTPPPGLIEAAFAAHHALGLSYSGIDIKVDEGNRRICVLEVNANPGFAFLSRFYPEKALQVQRTIAQRITRDFL